MSLPNAVIDAMLAHGCTAEQLAAAMKAANGADEARRERSIPWLVLRQMAFERDGYLCSYCGNTDGPFEIDHIFPRVKGGENTLENVTVACRRCNRSKRDREAPKL